MPNRDFGFGENGMRIVLVALDLCASADDDADADAVGSPKFEDEVKLPVGCDHSDGEEADPAPDLNKRFPDVRPRERIESTKDSLCDVAGVSASVVVVVADEVYVSAEDMLGREEAAWEVRVAGTVVGVGAEIEKCSNTLGRHLQFVDLDAEIPDVDASDNVPISAERLAERLCV